MFISAFNCKVTLHVFYCLLWCTDTDEGSEDDEDTDKPGAKAGRKKKRASTKSTGGFE